ncbi:hypothetical protein FHS57_005074 [Runella defluvii]|uniref:Uncharacterized protein n=1 Tax=Runella defluvii TaxID=370973 RepID=A0A7W5ZP71_9BACT|nr:hypothetical protein [Runella defluvii]
MWILTCTVVAGCFLLGHKEEVLTLNYRRVYICICDTMSYKKIVKNSNSQRNTRSGIIRYRSTDNEK